MMVTNAIPLTPLPSAIKAGHQMLPLTPPAIGYQCWLRLLPLTLLQSAINASYQCYMYLSLPSHQLLLLATTATSHSAIHAGHQLLLSPLPLAIHAGHQLLLSPLLSAITAGHQCPSALVNSWPVYSSNGGSSLA